MAPSRAAALTGKPVSAADQMTNGQIPMAKEAIRQSGNNRLSSSRVPAHTVANDQG
jgi:hypothetical protein